MPGAFFMGWWNCTSYIQIIYLLLLHFVFLSHSPHNLLSFLASWNLPAFFSKLNHSCPFIQFGSTDPVIRFKFSLILIPDDFLQPCKDGICMAYVSFANDSLCLINSFWLLRSYISHRLSHTVFLFHTGKCSIIVLGSHEWEIQYCAEVSHLLWSHSIQRLPFHSSSHSFNSVLMHNL